MIEDIPYAQRQALSDRYAFMDTDVLVAMWIHEERLPWADEILHRELRGRGYTSDDLGELKAIRPKEFVYRHTADDKVSKRLAAAISSVGIGSLLGLLTNWHIGFLVGSVLFSVYALYLLWGLERSLDAAAGTAAKLYVLYDTGKIAFIAGASIYGSLLLLTSRT